MSEKGTLLCSDCKNKYSDLDGLFFCTEDGNPADQSTLQGCSWFEPLEIKKNKKSE